MLIKFFRVTYILICFSLFFLHILLLQFTKANFLIYYFKLWLLLSLSLLSSQFKKFSTSLTRSHDLNIKPQKCQIWLHSRVRVNMCQQNMLENLTCNSPTTTCKISAFKHNLQFCQCFLSNQLHNIITKVCSFFAYTVTWLQNRSICSNKCWYYYS